jgi:hypothetical protein
VAGAASNPRNKVLGAAPAVVCVHDPLALVKIAITSATIGSRRLATAGRHHAVTFVT